MRRIGSSFSQADIKAAIVNNMSEIRAVTPEFTFIAKRPDAGWPTVQKFMENNERNNQKLFKEFYDRIQAGTTTVQKAEIVHWHTVNKRSFGELGIKYTKERLK